MNARCSKPKRVEFRHYGGRGITVCKRWQKFENFYADMGDPPDGLTLERKDNDKGYSKGNCKWATVNEQRRNTRRTSWFKVDGKKMSLHDAAAYVGIKPATLLTRLKRGWSHERAITEPTYPIGWGGRF